MDSPSKIRISAKICLHDICDRAVSMIAGCAQSKVSFPYAWAAKEIGAHLSMIKATQAYFFLRSSLTLFIERGTAYWLRFEAPQSSSLHASGIVIACRTGCTSSGWLRAPCLLG